MFGVLRIARERKWKVADLLSVLGVEPPPPVYQRPAEPVGWFVVMPFGKHKGSTLGAIAENDPDYIEWLAETADLRSGSLKRAVEAVYEWLQDR